MELGIQKEREGKVREGAKKQQRSQDRHRFREGYESDLVEGRGWCAHGMTVSVGMSGGGA